MPVCFLLKCGLSRCYHCVVRELFVWRIGNRKTLSFLHGVMTETQDQWYNRQAVEQLAQHIPFERDSASKAEQIEMLRGLVLRHGREMDPTLFGFEARNELMRLGLWMRIGKEEHG